MFSQKHWYFFPSWLSLALLSTIVLQETNKFIIDQVSIISSAVPRKPPQISVF